MKKILNYNILSLEIHKGSTINWNDKLEYFQSFNVEILDANWWCFEKVHWRLGYQREMTYFKRLQRKILELCYIIIVVMDCCMSINKFKIIQILCKCHFESTNYIKCPNYTFKKSNQNECIKSYNWFQTFLCNKNMSPSMKIHVQYVNLMKNQIIRKIQSFEILRETTTRQKNLFFSHLE